MKFAYRRYFSSVSTENDSSSFFTTTTTTTIYFGIPIYIHGITYTSSTNQVLHVSKNNITDY